VGQREEHYGFMHNVEMWVRVCGVEEREGHYGFMHNVEMWVRTCVCGGGASGF